MSDTNSATNQSEGLCARIVVTDVTGIGFGNADISACQSIHDAGEINDYESATQTQVESEALQYHTQLRGKEEYQVSNNGSNLADDQNRTATKNGRLISPTAALPRFALHKTSH